MIIFHSREALTARVAALLYVGRLPLEATPAQTWTAIRAWEAYRWEGLWSVGQDRWGEPVYAVGRASRPDVVDRVFHGLAGVFGIEPDSYLLINVGPVQAWPDLAFVGLRRTGLGALARRFERDLIGRRWPVCLEAVEHARFRSSERRQLRAAEPAPVHPGLLMPPIRPRSVQPPEVRP